MKGTSVMKQLPALEQVRGAIRALQTSMIVLLTKIISNINLKTLKVNLSCLTGSRTCLSGWMHYSS